MSRYKVGITPKRYKAEVVIYDSLTGFEIKENTDLFGVFRLVKKHVDISDVIVLIKSIDLITPKFNLWQSFSKVFKKVMKYETWKRYNHKSYIPEKYQISDLQSDYMKTLVDYSELVQVRTLENIIKQEFIKFNIDCKEVINETVEERIKNIKKLNKMPSSYPSNENGNHFIIQRH